MLLGQALDNIGISVLPTFKKLCPPLGFSSLVHIYDLRTGAGFSAPLPFPVSLSPRAHLRPPLGTVSMKYQRSTRQ